MAFDGLGYSTKKIFAECRDCGVSFACSKKNQKLTIAYSKLHLRALQRVSSKEGRIQTTALYFFPLPNSLSPLHPRP